MNDKTGDYILRTVLKEFELDAHVRAVEPIKRGHIHETFLVESEASEKTFILQRMNRYVFPDIATVMANIELVTSALQRKREGDPSCLETYSIIPTRSEARWLERDGDVWRVLTYIQNTESFTLCRSANMAERAGAACGSFLRTLVELDPKALGASIPNFHHAPTRYNQFRSALDGAEAPRRAAAREDIAFAFDHEESASRLVLALESRGVPVRVCHNDTKLNNILFDRVSGAPRAIIDLDTCMAGTALFDFGDLARNICVSAPEDEADLSRVRPHDENLRATLRGFLGATTGMLTSTERALMPAAPGVMALVLGVRFLGDYLSGDKYFRINHPAHNLQRARAQFEVFRQFELARERMECLIEGTTS